MAGLKTNLPYEEARHTQKKTDPFGPAFVTSNLYPALYRVCNCCSSGIVSTAIPFIACPKPWDSFAMIA